MAFIAEITFPDGQLVGGSGSGLTPVVSGPETSEEQKKRFEIECEFVQSLANPHYLNFLAQRGYFKEPYFINYLKYLLYWKRQEYARLQYTTAEDDDEQQQQQQQEKKPPTSTAP
ncbi:unnamed protein product [Gongylonema pulchrum]|uniref:Mediator of RNA polymerase II transcription subunit 31 n=1 Tax=Gongylonema pulchrum TaxID=637853 RepID=A0A183E8Y3_9BILA|nr:unnamed protein product [Gongylonema pulchrum]